MDDIVGLFDPYDSDDQQETLPDTLPPEVEEGNIEYKRKLVSPSASRLEHLTTQMKWRLQEGEGEAIYEIGVEDSGMLAGLTAEELSDSLDTLKQMATKLGATVTILREREVESSPVKKAVEILVRKVPENQQFIDLRLAVLGNVDAGKSTLIGVLTQGELDNGRGRARLNLFRHLHEIQSGRTSSISHEILGFDSDGNLVNYSESRSLEEICERSSKLITLMDLCGHTKYQKTTVFGLTGYSPDFAMLVVSATTGMAGTTKEHLGLALALGVPVFIVVSKVDMCTEEQLDKTIHQLERILKEPGCNKVPFRVEIEDDAMLAATTFHSDSICPIFSVSCVNGKGLQTLVKFLNVLPPMHSSKEREKDVQQHTEHQIDEVYSIPGVGTVAAGTVLRGTMREGDELLLGPCEAGEFKHVTVGSLHRNRLPCNVALAGQSACVAIVASSLGQAADGELPTVRRGMVLLSPQLQPIACTKFQATVYFLFTSRQISQGFQAVVHVGNVRQTAVIREMNKDVVASNEQCIVTFEFFSRPEYVRPGARLIFREGHNKGMGEVTKVFPLLCHTHCER